MKKRVLIMSMAMLCGLMSINVHAAQQNPVVVQINEQTFPDKAFRDFIFNGQQDKDNQLTAD